MKKGLLIAAIVVIAVIGLGVLMIAAIRALMDQQLALADKTVLVIELKGEVPEAPVQDLFSQLMQSQQVSFWQLHESVRKATLDSSIAGIWLQVGPNDLGWAKVQELQSALDEFRAAGKFIVASGEFIGEREYAAVLPANEIYLPDIGRFEFDGFEARAVFIRQMLENIHVEPQVERFKEYKSYGDMFDRRTMSAAQREAMDALLDDTLAQFLQMVEKYRGLKPEQTRDLLLERGLAYPSEALEAGLIDGEKYFSEVEDLLKEKTGVAANRKLATVNARKYRRRGWDAIGAPAGDQIAVLFAVGTITQGQDSSSPLFGRTMGSDSFIEQIRAARENKSIKAVIVRIDSPGGDAVASDMMWQELRLTNETKPVIACMSDVAASGGYYIAMGCRRIVAHPGTITGSIGVVSMIPNMGRLYQWMGLDFETITRGRWAGMPTELRAMTPEERARFREQTAWFYEKFVQKAADSRDFGFDELEPLARGRVWSGDRAAVSRLVDALGGFDQAIALARQEAGLEADAPVRLVPYPRPKKLLDQILESMADSEARAIPPQIRYILQQAGPYVLPGQGAILAVMPYVIEIR